jgi:hypothetical protein
MKEGGSKMKLPRRHFLHLDLAAGAAALPAVQLLAWAQAYPSRPVRVVVGYPPGTTPDILARLMSQWLSERLSQPFVVENKPGAASKIKFVNNLLVTINTAAIGEAAVLALKAGVEPEMMIKAISSGSGGSVLFPIRAPRMVKKDYQPPQGTFRELSHYFGYTTISQKRRKARRRCFASRPICSGAAFEHGLAQHDVAAIIEVVHELSAGGKEKAKIKPST